jgi:hypothetical protein
MNIWVGVLIARLKWSFNVKLVWSMHPCLKNDPKKFIGRLMNMTPGSLFTKLLTNLLR